MRLTLTITLCSGPRIVRFKGARLKNVRLQCLSATLKLNHVYGKQNRKHNRKNWQWVFDIPNHCPYQIKLKGWINDRFNISHILGIQCVMTHISIVGNCLSYNLDLSISFHTMLLGFRSRDMKAIWKFHLYTIVSLCGCMVKIAFMVWSSNHWWLLKRWQISEVSLSIDFAWSCKHLLYIAPSNGWSDCMW